MNILVINSGSSSIKYQLIDTASSLPLVKGKVERLSTPETYHRALQSVAKAVAAHRIDAVGHRVVHGGDRFSMPHLIDDAVLSAIHSCTPLRLCTIRPIWRESRRRGRYWPRCLRWRCSIPPSIRACPDVP